MKTEIFILFFCFFNLGTEHVAEKTATTTEKDCAMTEIKIDKLSPLFLIEP